MMPMKGLHLRRATPLDIPELTAIEGACFSQPWSEKAFGESMAQENTLFLCAEIEGTVVSYIGLYLSFDEAEVTNIATLPSYRRKGIARALLKEAADTLILRGIVALHLDVRVSNEGAQALYRSMGFTVDGIRRGFYSMPREDAVLMTKILK